MTAAEPQFLYLTTTGRRTGRPREIEIWFTVHRGKYYVLAENGHEAHWVKNVSADPRVRIRVGASDVAARARVVDDGTEPERVRGVRARSVTKYGWGDGLVVELAPENSG